MSRIYIFTGKGGVGKTSVAAAHAVKSAEEGKRTLLVSADMAPNLGDVFGVEAGSGEKTVRDNLSILELDPERLMRTEYPGVNRSIAKLMGQTGGFDSGDQSGRRSLGSMLGGAGASTAGLGDTFIIPGFENLFSLLKIRDLYLSGRYDRIIVDCAPTGETLSLLKLPELLTWYMEKFFPVGKALVRIMAPVSKHKYKVELPDRAAMNEIGQMHQKLVRLQNLLRDPDVCCVRLVCIPERMVVEETKRSYMYLNLYGYQVDGVYINRILPDLPGNPFMEHWARIQKPYIEELEKVFTGLPITGIPWYPTEVRGMEAVGRLCSDVLKDKDLFETRVRTEHDVYETVPGGYCLHIKLPGVSGLADREGGRDCDSENLQVAKYGPDLDIQINNYMRRIPLPDVLRGAEIAGVKAAGDELQISFRMENAQDPTGTDKAAADSIGDLHSTGGVHAAKASHSGGKGGVQ